jgi:hypothetical protein
MRNAVWALAFFILSSCNRASPAGGKLTPVSRSALCATEGTLEPLAGPKFSVSVPKMRAYLEEQTQPDVEAQFKYLGATDQESPLGSGEVRRQFGLKLRAQDACNLVYAMWRIEPQSQLVVSVKSNPGQHSSAECGNRGYTNIKPLHSQPVPALHPGDAHTLRADMNGAELKVLIDGNVVWDGSVGNDALSFDGPVGIRSDNAKLEIGLSAGQPLKGQSEQAGGCRAGAGDSD